MSLSVARLTLLFIFPLSVLVTAQAPSADQQKAPAGKGIIRGVVTAADTGRPLLRAEVRMQSLGLTPPESRAVLTDEKGRFEATALRAGRYTISAAKAGYVTLSHGQIRAREG